MRSFLRDRLTLAHPARPNASKRRLEAQAELDVHPVHIVKAHPVGGQRHNGMIGKVLAKAAVQGCSGIRNVRAPFDALEKEVIVSGPKFGERFQIQSDFHRDRGGPGSVPQCRRILPRERVAVAQERLPFRHRARRCKHHARKRDQPQCHATVTLFSVCGYRMTSAKHRTVTIEIAPVVPPEVEWGNVRA